MKLRQTNRNFDIIEFVDRYGKECSLQKSSLATEDAIWFGCNEGLHFEGKCMARMHLTQEQVAELLPYLQHFIETGELE